MKTILVVDDEFGIGEVLDAVLADAGYRSLVATNGRQALALLAAERVDLILSDLMMPVMDGSALFAALQQRDEFRAIPFVLMCSLPEPAIADRIRGYVAFLHKPFRIPALLDVIQRLIGPPT